MTLSHPPLALLFVASLALAAGCDKPADGGKSDSSASAKSGGGKVASCDTIKAESLCREYGDANVSAAGEDFLKKNCSGDFKMEACPKDKRVGSCATQEGTKVFYTDGPAPLAADKAEKACKEGVPAGEWKAGQ